MAVAIVIEFSQAAQLQAGLGIAFRIELDQLDAVRGDKGHEGDMMRLGHGMVDGDEMLILHIFDGYGVGFIGILRFQRRQGDPAAADHGAAHGVDGIAADGTDVKFSTGPSCSSTIWLSFIWPELKR